MSQNNFPQLNFAFFGTPDVASETLEILKQSGYIPSLIITSPDRPQGRKMAITPPPAKVWAIENAIPYIQPETTKELEAVLRTSAQTGEASKAIFQQENMRGEKNSFQFDLFIVVAYGKIIPEEILNIPGMGSVNVHYSLLPKYRGASPVESAVLNGDTKTGVTIQKMVYKMDAGPVIALAETDIGPDENAPDLRKRLIKLGGELLVQTLPKIIERKIKETPQDETGATHCKKIKKEDGLLDPSGNPEMNYNKFRAYAHWPRTFFFKDGKRIIITDATLKNGQFIIKKVLPEGKKEITWDQFTKLPLNPV